jgi:uncharacterized protein (DUF427 family)
MLRAIWNGTVIAEAPRTELVEGNHYFPPESVHRQYLLPSFATSHCPWKGKAHYWILRVDGRLNPDAAWTYPEPLPPARRIAGHVAFWRGVTIEELPDASS